jgi:hypothetical protein
MTAVASRPEERQLWGGMPGWGVVADLTPPELISARRLRELRKLIGIALAGVLVLCVLAFVWASRQASAAGDDADRAAATTVQLQASVNKYSGITKIENEVKGITAQVQTAMKSDVDSRALLAEIRRALPADMGIQNLSVDLSAATTAAAMSDTLDLSGHLKIGTATIGGAARHIDDLPTFVDHLSALTGVTNVVPKTNQAGANGVQFSVTMDLTDALYSHHYDATSGGK